ncbi:unnamed protein product, partial [marine sediment metagenome]
EAEKALKSTTGALSKAREESLEEAALAPYLKAVSDAQYRYRQLLIKFQEEK